MIRYSITLIALSLLAGCATAPPPQLRADDPASPSAPEAPVHQTRNALGTDGLTKKTRQILAQADKERQQSDQSGQEMPQRQSQPSPTPDN